MIAFVFLHLVLQWRVTLTRIWNWGFSAPARRSTRAPRAHSSMRAPPRRARTRASVSISEKHTSASASMVTEVCTDKR